MEVLDKHVRARLVDTQSDLVRERIRLKKRRLESHFKESRNVTRAAFTIAVEEVGDSVIGGYFLRLSARAPVSYIPVAFRFTSMPVMERCRALLNGEEPPKDLIE